MVPAEPDILDPSQITTITEPRIDSIIAKEREESRMKKRLARRKEKEKEQEKEEQEEKADKPVDLELEDFKVPGEKLHDWGELLTRDEDEKEDEDEDEDEHFF